MTVSRNQLILLGIAAVILLIVGIMAGRGCSHGSGPIGVVDPGSVDAGPGDEIIASALDGAIQMDQQRMTDIERKFQDDLAAFDAQQRADYERTRAGSLEDAARVLSQWNRQRLVMAKDAGA